MTLHVISNCNNHAGVREYKYAPWLRSKPPIQLSTGAVLRKTFPFPSLHCSFVDATMLSARPQAIAFPPNTTGSKKPAAFKLQGLQVNLGSPFRIVLLNVDSDVETPSPQSVCFDLRSSLTKTLPTTNEWSDFDCDSDSDSESDSPCDDSQYISIPPHSPFYVPHPPPTFQSTFNVPSVPDSTSESDGASYDSQCISIWSDSPFYSAPTPPTLRSTFDLPPVPLVANSRSITEDFHAELQRILPAEVKKDLFFVAEECLQGLDEELYTAPLDAFMDVCLARLRPATALPVNAAALAPTCYLASFVEPKLHGAASLPPNFAGMFSKHTISTDRRRPGPAF
ncbi:hypothetical protein B0H15DRAFT_543869 [Mycena belliarum]|uniref:Uncharacterized protein n=1 Tax=Mycena belliarum TaxID=1033014 RepID=A0AAD6UD86_9AGAR|nr:hypothetical protein B0H15DRAFT_543869 [Mycena belliae]